MEAAKRVQVITDHHGAGIGPMIAHRCHLGPFTPVNVELADFIRGLTVGEIASHDINEALVVEASETGPCMGHFLAPSDGVVLQVPFLHLIRHFICDFIGKGTGNDENAVSWNQDGPAKEECFCDWLRGKGIGLDGLPLEVL